MFRCRTISATAKYDVVGLAGTAKFSLKKSPIVWNNSPKDAWSGSVAHRSGETVYSSTYGPTPKQCLLVDGLFLAVNVANITEKELLFNERFKFHFYDLSFCIEAYKKGLTVGTWPIWVIHESPGDYRKSAEWHESEKIFKEIYGTTS